MILHPELHSVYQYGSAELEMLEVLVPDDYVGKRVTSLEVPGEIHVVAVLRGHAGLLPSARMEFETGDFVYLNALRESVPRLKQMLGMEG
jgi:trk system potassium uptake protein TrkA